MLTSSAGVGGGPAATWTFGAKSAAQPSAAEQAFDDYAKMTPAQKMRAAILGSMNLTEDQLKAMPPEQRKAMEEKIREIMKAKVEAETEKKTGSIVDLKA